MLHPPIMSIEDTYEPLIVFEILTIEKKPSILSLQTHVTVLENLGKVTLFYVLKSFVYQFEMLCILCSSRCRTAVLADSKKKYKLLRPANHFQIWEST
ncbi:hypothetical protein P8452_66349 [Trifolium repens]|nr:hypothetical protein P8452_48293 [Trifolium repens]WJX83706.1 hypothetical protein P8452_66349 [Trifolium repens]